MTCWFAFEADAGFDDVLLMVFELTYDGFFWSRCGAFFSLGLGSRTEMRCLQVPRLEALQTCPCGQSRLARVSSGCLALLVTWSTSRGSPGPSRWIYPDILSLGHLWTDMPGQNVSSDVQWLHRW